MHQSDARGQYRLPEITGGGVALIDVDNDADLDLFFVQSGCLNSSCTTPLNHALYRNLGDGRFSEPNNLPLKAGQHYGMGIATGDYDNDGLVDLYITHYGMNQLFHNKGNGEFHEVAVAAGVADEGWGTSASFADFDKDGYLDLYVVNYMHWNKSARLDCSATGIDTYCLPLHDYAAMDRIYRNNGDGTFEDRTLSAGLGSAFGNGLGVVANDFNQDGWVDVFVANDSMVNQLWINQGDFTFEDQSWLRGVAMDDHGIEKAGMGVTSFDYDADHDYDILVVNIEGQTDSLFRNDLHYFSDMTGSKGLGGTSRRYTRFGLITADFDNDGCADIYQANGKVFHDEEDLHKVDFFAEPNALYRGHCGSQFEWIPKSEIVNSTHEGTSRGAAVGDINNDGLLDIVVVNKDAQPHLMIGQPTEGDSPNWIRFRAINRFGRDDYNAEIRIKTTSQEASQYVQTDGSYLSAKEPVIHFGLGSTDEVLEVHVSWLDGTTETYKSLSPNSNHVLVQGEGQLVSEE